MLRKSLLKILGAILPKCWCGRIATYQSWIGHACDRCVGSGYHTDAVEHNYAESIRELEK